MKTPLAFLAGILALTLNFAGPLRAADQPIDTERAKELFQRARAGEKLTDNEQKYLDEAKRQRDAQQGVQPGNGEFSWDRARATHEKEQRGESLSDDEKKLLAEARKRFEEGRGPEQPQPQTAAQTAPQRPQGDRPQAKDDFDWEKARAAHEKEKRGEALTPDEKTLLDAAKKRIAEGRGPGRRDGAQPRPQDGQRPPLAPPPKDLVPLN
ncbi:MAG: hypothetical protein ABI318_19715, partial [Chthoniobacteraceae bacterium]